MRVFAVLAVIVAVCLASVATATQNKGADFDGLNKHLSRKLKDDYNREANLAVIEFDVDNLTGGVRKAAEIVMALKDLKAGVECDPSLKETVARALAGGLRPDDEPKLKQRVHRFVKPQLKVAVEACADVVNN